MDPPRNPAETRSQRIVMAKIKIFCPHCGQSLQCDESHQGKQVRCPPCVQLFLVPQMSLHATPNEAAKVQFSDEDIAFWKDFYEKYPDLPPHESVVDAVTVKLKASGYKGSREEVFETIAKAARQELARQQQSPPIVEVGQSDRVATSSQNTPREWVELDRQEEHREEHESIKGFLCFWGFGLVWFLINQAPTAALSWFLGFPIARWIYLKIKKRHNG